MADLFIDPELRPSSYYRPQRYNAGSAFGKFALLGVILLVVGGGVTYFLLKRSVVLNTTAPTILAEAGPVKERPTDPGGIAVLHQDTTIYDRLDKAEGRGKVEQLLPSAEKPDAALLAETSAAKTQPVPVIETGKSATTELIDATLAEKPVEKPVPQNAAKPTPKPDLLTAREETSAPVKPRVTPPAPETKTIAAVPEPKKIQPPPEAKAAPVPQPFKTPEQMAALAKPQLPTVEDPATTAPVDVAQILARSGIGQVEKPTVPTPASLPTAPGKGLSRVQLGSSPNQEAVEQKMMTMVSKHAALLRNTRLNTARADLGAKGIYYRIQTQAMPTAEASQLCGRLKAAQVECLIVKTAP